MNARMNRRASHSAARRRDARRRVDARRADGVDGVDDARDRVRGQREQDLRRRRARGRDDPGEPAGDVRDAAGHGIPAARDGETPPRRRGRTRATGAGGGERVDARRGRGVLHARAGDGGAADDGGGVREDAGAAVR